jgi:hypothetical protein
MEVCINKMTFYAFYVLTKRHFVCNLGMKNKQHITVLLSRFVAAVSACTRYCIRTLKYTVNKASSLRDLSVIAGILWMRLRTKYTDGDCRLSITDPAQSRRDDTLLTVYFSIRTWRTWGIPIEKQRTDDALLSLISYLFFVP